MNMNIVCVSDAAYYLNNSVATLFLALDQLGEEVAVLKKHKDDQYYTDCCRQFAERVESAYNPILDGVLYSLTDLLNAMHE